MKPTVRLGLTGGIGSGKSTVAAMLCAHGATLIDADAISRQCTSSGGAAVAAITALFGPEFLTPAGAMDREKMRKHAFDSPDARVKLQNIVHPLVALETERQTAEAMRAGAKCIVFDVPLLVESNKWRRTVHQVRVVDCPTDVQTKRVMARNQMDKASVQSIMAAQVTRGQRNQCADMVLFNGSQSLEELASHVSQVARKLGL